MQMTEILMSMVMMGGITAITWIIFRSPMKKVKAELFKQQKLKELNAPEGGESIQKRLDQLESVIKTQETEIETLSEETRFLKRLLDDKQK